MKERKDPASLYATVCVISPFPQLWGIGPLQRKNSIGLFNPSSDDVAAGCSLRSTIIPLRAQLRHQHRDRHLPPQLPPVCRHCLWKDAYSYLRTQAQSGRLINMAPWKWLRWLNGTLVTLIHSDSVTCFTLPVTGVRGAVLTLCSLNRSVSGLVYSEPFHVLPS